MSTQRLAIIDLGTNSARLLVADVGGDRRWARVGGGRVPCRLGERLGETGSIDPAAEARTARALQDLVRRARAKRAERLQIIATHALRAASNGEVCRRRLEREVGEEIRVLDGEEEARLVFDVARAYGVARDDGRWATLDLGGGSLELGRDDAGAARLVSLSLGAVVVAHRLPVADAIPRHALEALREHVRAVLEEQAADFRNVAADVAGAGGTVTSAATLAGASPPLSGYALRPADLERRLEHLAALGVAQRAALRGVADRADIIVPGLAVLCEASRFLGAERLIVLEHGVREGALLALARATP